MMMETESFDTLLRSISKMGSVCNICLNSSKILFVPTVKHDGSLLISDKLLQCVPEINWVRNTSILICSSCIENLELFYDFRKLCLKSNQFIQNNFFELNMNNDEAHEFSKNDEFDKKLNFTDSDYKKCCYVCLKIDGLLISVNDKGEDSILISDKVIECVPEIDWRWYSTSTICNSCNAILNISYNFRKLCLEASKTIDNNSLQINEKINVHEDHNGQHIIDDSTQLNLVVNGKLSDFLGKIDENHENVGETQKVPISFVNFEKSPLLETERSSISVSETEITEKKDNDEISDSGSEKDENVSFDCFVCEKQFTKLSDLDEHIESHSTDEEVQFSCKICNETFVRKSNLEAHNKKFHRVKQTFICDVCDEIFDSKTILESHKSKHEKDESFTCRICNEFFDLKPHFDIHMKTHKIVRPYCCEYCDETFCAEKDLSVHINTHTKERPFTCSKCDNTYVTKSALKGHMFRNHSDTRNFSCEHCDKTFKCNTHLENHRKIHSNDRPYSCNICDKKFKNASNQKSHIRGHLNERPFPCTICDRTFKMKNDLKIHLRVHTGERPFPCDHCDKSFNLKFDLKLHVMRIHTKERPFSCDKCDKAYANRKHLKRHMLTHTGDRPFSCKLCDKTYREKCDLNLHMKSHSGKRPFICGYCEASFFLKKLLNRHVLQVHFSEFTSKK